MVAVPLLLRLPVTQCLGGHSEPFNTGRHSTVSRSLQNHLSYLLFRCTIIQSSSNVCRELRGAVLAAEHGDVQEGARLEF